MTDIFSQRLAQINALYEQTVGKKNHSAGFDRSGYHGRFRDPVLTADHIPPAWRYDLNPGTNPWLMQRFGINTVMNAGAIKWKNKYLIMARVEGVDRKSFFAIADSESGIDGFRFWEHPVVIPANSESETNLYDIRLTVHEDGWIYGLFCVEIKDPAAGAGDQSSAIAQCGIIRTKDMQQWQRLPDLITPSPQQRNVVLHPELIGGQYAFYTRPQQGFIGAGEGGGIGLGFSTSIENAIIKEEKIIDQRIYHTVNESKNGQGPPPLKTPHGWLHLAHGVRLTAAGLRYVLYLFLTDMNDIGRTIAKPGGYFLAPENEERTGDVSNVLFCNGWVRDDDDKVFIYYASSDTRMHVAVSSIDQLTDYVLNTPPDGLSSAASVRTIQSLISSNLSFPTQKSRNGIFYT